MAKKSTKMCSDFEEMLMWTSYRYCIGRHTYVVSMAREIAQNYYHRLSDERKIFTAKDIRSEIMHHLQFLPVDLKMDRMYDRDSNNILGALLGFINSENVQSESDLLNYSKIDFDMHSGKYEFDTIRTRNISTYFSVMDIEDLIPWEHLASCFDVASHKILELSNGEKVEVFSAWAPKLEETDQPYTYRKAFGWDSVWVSVNEYVGNDPRNLYIPKDSEHIVKVHDINDTDNR